MQEPSSAAVAENDQSLFLRISIVTGTDEPGTVLRAIEDLGIYPRTIMDAWILSILQLTIGFNFTLTTSSSYGEFDSTTQVWNGLTGSLQNNTIELGISSFIMQPSRYNAVDYSFPIGTTPDFMAFYRSPSVTNDSWALLKPFHANLWIVIAILVVITSILFALILIASNDFRKDCKPIWRRAVSAIHSGFLWSIEMMFLNSDCTLDVSKATMILFLTLSPTAFMINAAYNGMLLSFLTVPSEPFKRLDQLMAVPFEFVINGHLQFVVDALEASSDTKGFRKVVKEPREAPQGLKSVKNEVLRGSFAFICIGYDGYIDLQDGFTPTERASIAELTVLSGTTKHALMLPKGSPYKHLINYQLLRAKQSGHFSLLYARLNVRRPDSTGSDPLPQPQISIVSTLVASVAFICGLFAAALTFLCEIL